MMRKRSYCLILAFALACALVCYLSVRVTTPSAAPRGATAGPRPVRQGDAPLDSAGQEAPKARTSAQPSSDPRTTANPVAWQVTGAPPQDSPSIESAASAGHAASPSSVVSRQPAIVDTECAMEYSRYATVLRAFRTAVTSVDGLLPGEGMSDVEILVTQRIETRECASPEHGRECFVIDGASTIGNAIVRNGAFLSHDPRKHPLYSCSISLGDWLPRVSEAPAKRMIASTVRREDGAPLDSATMLTADNEFVLSGVYGRALVPDHAEQLTDGRFIEMPVHVLAGWLSPGLEFAVPQSPPNLVEYVFLDASPAGLLGATTLATSTGAVLLERTEQASSQSHLRTSFRCSGELRQSRAWNLVADSGKTRPRQLRTALTTGTFDGAGWIVWDPRSRCVVGGSVECTLEGRLEVELAAIVGETEEPRAVIEFVGEWSMWACCRSCPIDEVGCRTPSSIEQPRVR